MFIPRECCQDIPNECWAQRGTGEFLCSRPGRFMAGTEARYTNCCVCLRTIRFNACGRPVRWLPTWLGNSCGFRWQLACRGKSRDAPGSDYFVELIVETRLYTRFMVKARLQVWKYCQLTNSSPRIKEGCLCIVRRLIEDLNISLYSSSL